MVSAWRCALAVLVILPASFATAGDLEQLLVRARTSTSTGISHVDGAVYLQGNQPLCAFGVIQLPDEKPRYSYFVLFKAIPDPKDEFKVTGPVRSRSNQFDYQLIVTVGKREVTIAHKYKYDADARKVITDDLSVGDKKVKPGDSRFFIVDLAGENPMVTTVVRPLPEKVLAPTADMQQLDFVRDLSESLREDKDLSKLLR